MDISFTKGIMKKILVIGGSGFVGSRLIELCGHNNCLNIDKSDSQWHKEISVKKNIINRHSLQFEQNIDCVVLLAAEHRDDVFPKSLYYDVNVEGTRNVLEEMDRVGIKHLIFTSSVAVYGLNKHNPNEAHHQDPFNDYGKSKFEAEEVIKHWYETNPKEKSVTIIRPTVIFGERNRGNVFNLLKQISSGRFLMIGSGQNKKSMAYIGNVVAFIKNRIETRELGYNVYNYSDKPDFTMSELSSVIEKKMNLSIPNTKIPFWLGMLGGYGFDVLALLTRKRFSISSIRVKKFCATTQFDSTKAHSVFKAPYSLEEGLNKTLEFEFINTKEDKTVFYSE